MVVKKMSDISRANTKKRCASVPNENENQFLGLMIRNRSCLHLDEDNCDGHSIEAKYCQQLPCPLSQGNGTI